MLQLAYPIDDTVEIDGQEYTLDMSFDNVLRLIDMVNDGSINDRDKITTGIQMLLGVCFLHDIETQAEIFIELFSSTVGKEAENNQPVDLEGNPIPQPKNEKRNYSLKEDADFIFASFMSDYGIDLIEEQGNLHWLKFRALLGGLTEGSKFLRVLDIRTMDIPTGKGTTKQAEQVRKLKRQYALKGDDEDES